MWCCICKNDLVDCICPDLEERLDALSKCPSLTSAVEMNRKARKLKKKLDKDKKEKEGDCSHN